MSRVVWLLDMRMGGYTVRASTRPVMITGSDGREHSYPGGLGDVEVTSSAQAGPAVRSVAMEIDPPPGHTWASLVADGMRIAGGSATLRRWVSGTWEAAQTRAVGTIHNPSWSRGTGPLAISVEAAPWGHRVPVIPASRAISSETFPTTTAIGFPDDPFEIDPQVVGSYPPVVVGFPGDVFDRWTAKSGLAPDDTAVTGPPSGGPSRTQVWADLVEGSPSLMTDHWDYMADAINGKQRIASHMVTAEQVIIWDQSDKRYDVFAVHHEYDLQKQPTAYITWAGGGGSWVRSVMGHEYWAIFLDEPGYGGGLPSDRGGTMTGLGEFLGWLVARTARPESVQAQQGVRSFFDNYRIGAAINTDITVWGWVESNVLDVFPARFVEGPHGAHVAPYPVRGTASTLVDEIDPDRDGLQVVAAPQEDTADIANRLVLVYAAGRKRAVLTSSSSTERNERFDPDCRWSQEQSWGVVERTITSDIIWDDDVAWAVLRDMAPLVARPKVDIFVETSTDRLDGLWLLDQIGVRATEWGFPYRRGVVEVVSEMGDSVRLGIRLLEELT